MIKVLSSGFYTTVQDQGRHGYGELGVPGSGAMDLYSSQLANHILRNRENDALLEITLGKCKLIFEKQNIICISGANLSPTINGSIAPMNTAIIINMGDILNFDKPVFGIRCYLAIRGGFQTEVVLKSRSFYKGITSQFQVQKGDVIPAIETSESLNRSLSSIKVDQEHFTTSVIEVYKGPEYDLLNKRAKEKLNKINFTISKENSRMGYRLEEPIDNKLGSMLTSSVLPGTIQLTPSGKLIILMRDCQVTGGYPRILQLTEKSVNRLSQKSTGDVFSIRIVPLN